jgi:hypothetical protein
MRWLGTTQEALRLSAFTAVFFNFLSSYWAARGWLSRPRACAAAGIALLLPGVIFVALGRGMFPNFFALGWVAIAAGAGQRAMARRRYVAVLALAEAGLLLTHMPTAYLAAHLGATVAIALRKPCGARPVTAGALAGISALLVTGWFWEPMLLIASQAQTGYLAEAHPYVESLWWAASAPETPFERDWAFLNEAAAWLGAAQLALAAGLIPALPRGPLRCALTLTAAWTAFASLWPTGAWLASLPYYESVQFCWRWQPLLSLGCAFAFASLPARTALRFAPALAAGVGLFLPFASPSDRRPGKTPSLASNLIEMRPLGAGRELFPPGAAGRFETLSPDCTAALVELRPSRRIYRVSAGAPCVLRVLTYHFPGWRATLNGMPLEARAERETALQLLDIPAGTQVVELRYEPFAMLNAAGPTRSTTNE